MSSWITSQGLPGCTDQLATLQVLAGKIEAIVASSAMPTPTISSPPPKAEPAEILPSTRCLHSSCLHSMSLQSHLAALFPPPKQSSVEAL
jgi:hypothetical protein